MGVSICSVKDCQNRTSDKSIRFFYFPKKTEPAWHRACGREKTWKPTRNSVVCESHFSPTDFIADAVKKKLHKDAIPHVNLESSVRLSYDVLEPNKTTLVNKAEQPSHCAVRFENGFRKCVICNGRTEFRCEANTCKVSLCLSPCFQSYHEAKQNQGMYFDNHTETRNSEAN